MQPHENEEITPHVHCPVCRAASSDLREAIYPELEPFAIQGVFDCKVVRVFDGDTLWIAIRAPQPQPQPQPQKECRRQMTTVTRVNCRLLDIDTHEIPRTHSDAMNSDSVAAFAARDRLVELVTNVTIRDRDDHTNTSGLDMPSLTTTQLQEKMNKNDLILPQGLTLLRGTDKYGRYLARLRTKDGRDAASVLLDEGHAVPYLKG